MFALGGQENQGGAAGDASCAGTPGKDEYKKLLAASLNIHEQARVLAFKHKAPAPPDGHDASGLASLYNANLAQAPARKQFRHVPSSQERILDAPDLVDDYYLNLLDWSSNNVVRAPRGRHAGRAALHARARAGVRGLPARQGALPRAAGWLEGRWSTAGAPRPSAPFHLNPPPPPAPAPAPQIAVALGASVYLWNAGTGSVEELCTCKNEGDYVSSLQWAPDSSHLAIGTSDAKVQIWDVARAKQVRELAGHTNRVSALSWNGAILCQRRARQRHAATGTCASARTRRSSRRCATHEQEVCGLRGRPSGQQLASGGNDNMLCIWDANFELQHRVTAHQAAVKALAWCPFQSNLLASGGGTADRYIRSGTRPQARMLNAIDTGSQVCALQWSRHEREILSSHGYSKNQLCLWKYPTLAKVGEMTGHTARVLHMAQSPDGASVVTAGADETLRFWRVFGEPATAASKGARPGGGGGGGAARCPPAPLRLLPPPAACLPLTPPPSPPAPWPARCRRRQGRDGRGHQRVHAALREHQVEAGGRQHPRRRGGRRVESTPCATMPVQLRDACASARAPHPHANRACTPARRALYTPPALAQHALAARARACLRPPACARPPNGGFNHPKPMNPW